MRIIGVQAYSGMTDLRGQGLHTYATEDLNKFDLVTYAGKKGKADAEANFPHGFVGPDTGHYKGNPRNGELFHMVRHAWVVLSEANAPGTALYVDDSGEISTTAGTVKKQIGVVVADPRAGAGQNSVLAEVYFY